MLNLLNSTDPKTSPVPLNLQPPTLWTQVEHPFEHEKKVWMSLVKKQISI